MIICGGGRGLHSDENFAKPGTPPEPPPNRPHRPGILRGLLAGGALPSNFNFYISIYLPQYWGKTQLYSII